MSSVNAAGLLIFRYERGQAEFLLINNTFNHQRHWTPPKGQLVGAEDELKCAIRVSLDITGLTISDLAIEEAFSAKLKYISNTQAKHVSYFMAQLLDPHHALRIGAGSNYAWLPLNEALDKAMYANMEHALRKANIYIEEHRDRFARQSAPVSTYRDHDRSARDGGGRPGAYRPPHHRQANFESANVPSGEAGSPYSAGQPSGRDQNRLPHQRRPGPGSFGVSYGNRSQSPSGGDLADRMQGMRMGQHGQSSHHRMPGSDSNSNYRHHDPNDNPNYKTRLCERFEMEGECPYNGKCTFAHGAAELRERPMTSHHYQSGGGGGGDYMGRNHLFGNSYGSSSSGSQRPNPADNPLYKTRLCEKFMTDGFCQYGHKCHFAHGEEELKQRPAFPPSMRRDPMMGSGPNDIGSGYYSRTPGLQLSQNTMPLRGREPILLEPRTPLATTPGFADGHHLSVSASAITKPAEAQASPAGVMGASPAASSNDSVTAKKPSEDRPRSKKGGRDDHHHQNEPRRPRVVQVDPEELARFDHPPPNLRDLAHHGGSGAHGNSSASSRVAQDEATALEVRQLFPTPLVPADGPSEISKADLTSLAKEVTRFEFRHDLSKQQLFTVLLTAFFEPGVNSHGGDHSSNNQSSSNGSSGSPPIDTLKANKVEQVLTYYMPLLANYVKNTVDQRLLLNAWDRFFSLHAKQCTQKAPLVFKVCYDLDLIEEEVFLQWNQETPDSSEVKKKVAPFISWLSTAEEEDDEEESE